MTTGVLLFAYNNEHVDYLAMANWSAQNIRRHLNLPTCVVTDKPVPDHYNFEQVIIQPPRSGGYRRFEDLPDNVTWHNVNRIDTYQLTPWSHTLVLDADYVVASDQLTTLLHVDQDFVAHNCAYDITNVNNFEELNNFGRYKMPMWWATVMLFRKSPCAKMIFDCMNMIYQNWDHYRALHGIHPSTYRNDFALTMALGIVNGHVLNHAAIPWNLATLTHEHTLTQIDQDCYRADFITVDQRPYWTTINSDFHCMGKGHLGEIVANFN